MVDFDLDNIRYKVAPYKWNSQSPYTKIHVKVMIELSSIITTELNHSLWIERPVRPANGIHELVAHRLFEILYTNFFAVEKIFRKQRLLSILNEFQLFI